MSKKRYKLPIEEWKYENPLEDLRKELDLTQQEVVNLSGKSFDLTSYRPWEQSLTYPKVENLIKLASIFNVSTDYILGLDAHRNIGNTEISQITGLSDKSIEALRFFNSEFDDPEEAAVHRKTIEFINFALENVSEQIAEYRSSPEDHAPITTIFYDMIQYLQSEESKLRYREGDEYKILSSSTASFEINGDTTIYTIPQLGRTLILDHIKKWLDNRRGKNGIDKTENN